MSVGSICVLGEPWLELLADHFLLSCVNETLLLNFSEARWFCLLSKRPFFTLSPQSAGVFPKIGHESGKFRARGIEDVRYFQKL